MTIVFNSDGENVVRRRRISQCFYCEKVFKDSRALGGHLRSHQVARSRKSWNVPGRRSGISLNMIASTPNPHMTAQFKHLSGGFGNNQGAFLSKASPSVTFPQRFQPNNNGWVNVGQFSENRVGITQTPFSASPNFSSGGGRAENCHFNPFPSTAPAPTYPVITPNHPFLLGQGNVFQFSTHQSQSFMDGGQFSGNALPNFQYSNQGAYAGVIPNPLLGSNQLPARREPTDVGPFFPYPNHLSGLGGFGQDNENCILAPEGGKRHCVGEAPHMLSAPKRPKIDCNLMMETEEHVKKELLLVKGVEKSFSGLEISVAAKEEPETDLVDLSLHL